MKTLYIPLAAAVLILCTGCETTSVTPAQPLETTRTYAASPDQIWGELVSEVSAKFPIQTIERDSGLITTEFVSLGSSFAGWNTLKSYAYQPKSFLGTWTGGARTRFTFLVTPEDTGTKVRITAIFEGFENNVSHQWYRWQTNGTLEATWLDMLDRATAAE